MRATLVGALCVLTAASARAGVVVRPGVPFTAAQLEAAIAVRGGPGEDQLDVEVSRPSPERLALVTRSGRWEIEIGGAGGATAARIVALYVIAGSGSLGRAPGETAVRPAVEVQVAAAPEDRDRYRVAVFGLGSRGVSAGDFTWMGGAVELTRAGRWVAGGGLAWQHGFTIDHAGARPISAELVRARLVAGAAVGPLELVGGGFAGRVRVNGGTEVFGRWSTGLLGEARAALPVAAAWRLELAAGAELFQARIEVQAGGEPIGATPRIALGGRIGLAWTEGGR